MTRRTVVAAAVMIALGAAGTAVSLRRPAPAPPTQSPPLAPDARMFWQAFRAAAAARANGDCGTAITEYAHALLLRPDHQDSLYYLGNCYVERREYAKALAAYNRLIAVNPDESSRAYMQVGLVHASLEPGAPVDLPTAERFFRRALALDPDSGGLLGVGEVAVLRSEWTIAQDALVRVDADNTMSIAAPYLLGFLAWRSGQRTAAWTYFAAAVARGQLKKPTLKWTEEGDVKADPAVRWRALARQSVFGDHWMRLRTYLDAGGPTPPDMRREYDRLARDLEAFRARTPRL